ncbi:hypothetical protein [Streptomyces acidicola]|uniref:DUF3806 domain-containing protein n=1 Tax=Streptomyces acidicola TaxID=2596892 RepID=A0A5N8X5U7_9ACTN|nr:hypothetical protein [Streptomyces acidicola]MPY54474.1 hypothetical protein [Streptomyces acidicola]
MHPSDRDDLYAERSENLEHWVRDMESKVLYLADLLEIYPASELLEDPRLAIAYMDELYECEHIEELDDANFAKVFSVLLSFVGYYLIRKFDGHWEVDADRESPSYARYLVCLPDPHSDSEVCIDIGERVNEFLHEPVGRSFLRFLIRLEGLVAP